MKKFLVLLTAMVLVFSVFTSALAADYSTTIPTGKSAKKGNDVKKTDKSSEPAVNFVSIDSGSTIKFWIWRDSASAQVTKTYTFTNTGVQDVKYNNSGNKGKNENYHPVWKKTTQSLNSAVKIDYNFVP